MSSLIPEDETHIGSTGMNTAASDTVVLTNSSSLKRFVGGQRKPSLAEMYQGIALSLVKGFTTKQTLRDFITCVTSAADQSLAVRQYDTIGALSQLLLNLTLSPQVESIGHFYEALSINRSGRGDPVRARPIFEQVADRAPLHYRARAMLALAARGVVGGDYGAALYWYEEMMRISLQRGIDPATLYGAQQMTAVVKAKKGDHQGALADLEAMSPLARIASYQDPSAHYVHLNSLAVELAEVGRLEEAARASEIVRSSPFAPAYQEWQETFDDIAVRRLGASRSIVAVSGFAPPLDRRGETQPARHGAKTHKLVSISARQPALISAPEHDRTQNSPARILDFEQWKRRSEQNSAHLSALSFEQKSKMTIGEKLIRLMDLISHDETDDETIDVILGAVEAIVIGRKGAS